MEMILEAASYPNDSKKRTEYLLTALWGCALITLCSLVKVPLFPISFTLQTLAISLLALTQTPKQALASVLCYLFCATIGLPVLCGHSNPFWFMGKSGGFLIAFPLAAYLTSKLSQKSYPLLAVFCGQALIYLLGILWLTPLFGASTAFMKGCVLFIPGDILKNLIAIAIAVYPKQRKS